MRWRFLFMVGMAGFILIPSEASAVVGTENIDSERLYRFRREHEGRMSKAREGKDEEQILEQLRIAEEKKKELLAGKVTAEGEPMSEEEQRRLAKKIAELQVELVPKKRRWRDRMTIEPFGRVTYDSNLLRTPKRQAQADIYFDTGSQFKAELGSAKTQADVEYRGSRLTVLREGRHSRWQNDIKTELGYRASDKTELTGHYGFNSGSTQTSEFRNLRERIYQDANVGLNVRLSQKTAVRIESKYIRQDFLDKPRSDSSQQVQTSPELHYLVSDKTSLFGRYGLGFSRGGANDSNQAVSHDFRGGIRGKAAPKTSALLDFGASIQRNTGSLSGSNAAFVGEVATVTDVTPKTRVELFMNRNFTQAVQTKDTNFYVTTQFGLRASSRFTRRLLSSFALALRRNRFDHKGSLSSSRQRDTIVTALFLLQYELRKWLLAGLEYGFDIASSNQNSAKYTSHRISFEVKGRF